ncbi:hypothetical protein C2845_PM09G08510 [Panicum miliaceum]|uniref:Uncharacterized protein n=1 Tax=Panicum miliaceum TaxID=4540 RepID=A0A3L6S147_PANMI|nr:hypothetical protein C2845_PM09G08510 [Panicum miliaceum]
MRRCLPLWSHRDCAAAALRPHGNSPAVVLRLCCDRAVVILTVWQWRPCVVSRRGLQPQFLLPPRATPGGKAGKQHGGAARSQAEPRFVAPPRPNCSSHWIFRDFGAGAGCEAPLWQRFTWSWFWSRAKRGHEVVGTWACQIVGYFGIFIF